MNMPPHDLRDARADQTSAPDDANDESERLELLDHLQAILEPLMVGLGLIFLVLLLLDFSGILTDPRHGFWLSRSLTVIWAIFLADFCFRFVIAPSKARFLTTNWLTAASLALPFLRPIRALRALRAVRSLNLVRLIGGVNRGMRVLRRVIGGHQIAYLASLTLFMVSASTAGIWYFERDTTGATIHSFGDALWWASAMVTTINNEKFAVSPEGRVLAILLRIYAVSVFGFITATIARYLIGKDTLGTADGPPSREPLGTHLAALEQEIAALREALAQASPPAAPAGVAGPNTHDASSSR
jgi:voltage-gated potassium channel